MAKIAAFRGTPFDLVTYPEDREAVSLAEKVGGALVAARWVHTPSKSFLGFSIILGVAIHIAPSQKSNFGRVAGALAAALNEEGIASEVKIEAWQDEPAHDRYTKVIAIRIGRKP